MGVVLGFLFHVFFHGRDLETTSFDAVVHSVLRMLDTLGHHAHYAVNAGLDHLGFDAVTDEQNLVADLALDSLDRVDLTVTLEQEFNIDISDAALEEWQTVGDVVKTVEELVDA